VLCCAVLQNVSHQKVRLFGEAFAKIQEATGISDINELVNSFATAEVRSDMHGQGFRGFHHNYATLPQLPAWMACNSCAVASVLQPRAGKSHQAVPTVSRWKGICLQLF
jgi:hypothetical protein